MKCYCYETDLEFVYCVENVESLQLEAAVEHKGWKKTDGKFLMSMPQYVFFNPRDKELAKENFACLGQSMFEAECFGFDWRETVEMLALTFSEHKIEWYIVGSVCDAVRGVNVKPGDLDIVVHTRDYAKAKDVFYNDYPDSIIQPIIDYRGIMPLQYMGRMFFCGGLIEMGGDESWNLENRHPQYERTTWNGYNIYLDSFQLRYQTEIARKRRDRIKAFVEYLSQR